MKIYIDKLIEIMAKHGIKVTRAQLATWRSRTNKGLPHPGLTRWKKDLGGIYYESSDVLSWIETKIVPVEYGAPAETLPSEGELSEWEALQNGDE